MSVKRLFDIFKPDNYKIFLDLSNAKDKKFTGKVEIFGFSKNKESISLHSKDLEISSIFYGGEKLEFESRKDDEIEIFSGNKPFEVDSEIKIEIEFLGKITDGMHGLYPCYYRENGQEKQLFATQFESHHAREVFPCVDEPEAKATFELTLKTEKDLDVLANTPVLEGCIHDNKVIVSKFEKTPRMSSYLLAFVVGDLQKKTAFTKSGVEVSAWSTKAQKSEMLDFPLYVATKVLEFYEEYFDEDFPLKKCDHVALPDFSSGAMENWGLITYRESALLAGKESAISDRKYVALVIAHETAHQWFGNLVTMKWWDDLWLNESFATMMEYLAVDNLFPDWNIWEEFAVNEAIISLRRDAIDGVQSVHVPVHHPDEIGTIFDGAIVYAKGARLMNMLQNFIGEKAFRDGLQKYFKNFKYKNTVGADLWKCLGESSGENIQDFMEAWITLSGYPVVRADISNGVLNLSQKQFFVGSGVDNNKIWPIFLNSNQENLPRIMDCEALSIQFDSDYLKLNEGNISHFITNYSKNIFDELLNRIDNMDTISRLQLLQEQSLLARGGLVKSSNLLQVLSRFSNEESLNVWNMMNIVVGDLKIFVDENSETERRMKKFVRNLANNQFERLGFFAVDGESEEDTQNRSSILGHMIYADNENAIMQALEIFDKEEDLVKIDAEIRSLILTAKVRHDESGELISRLLELYKTTSDVDFRNDLMSALTSTKNEKTAKILLEKMTDNKIIRPQDLISWFVCLLRNSHARELTWRWLRENWDFIEKTFGDDKSYNDFPRYAGAILRTKKHLDEFVEFFSKMKNEPSLVRAIEMGEKDITSRIEMIEHDKDDFERALAKIVD